MSQLEKWKGLEKINLKVQGRGRTPSLPATPYNSHPMFQVGAAKRGPSSPHAPHQNFPPLWRVPKHRSLVCRAPQTKCKCYVYLIRLLILPKGRKNGAWSGCCCFRPREGRTVIMLLHRRTSYQKCCRL